MSGFLQNILKGNPSASQGGGGSGALLHNYQGFANFAPPVAGQAANAVPYTKWYRVWERTSPSDFIQEAFVIPFVLIIALFHFWGARKNRGKARDWAQAHLPVLYDEFAVVGYDGVPRNRSGTTDNISTEDMGLKEKSLNEFTSYATGRQNVAFMDVTIKMLKRYNPMIIFGDLIISLFFESLPQATENVEICAYAFDGKEKDLVPAIPAGREQQRSKVGSSTYDGFVFAVAHKNCMRQLRQDRYDVSLTFTKDNAKLPAWLTVMSESAEITDLMLSPELIKAVEEVGDLFQYLVISDQPADKPTSLDEATPTKRMVLSLRLPSSLEDSAASSALLRVFVRLMDRVVTVAHFRPEVSRKLRNTRVEETKRLQRADEEEKSEERKLAAEKLKKEERERTLRSMSAEEQRKYLEKEKDREQRRELKRHTKRG
ncbi:hypothetical protein FQN57_006007 [Myotisia sp. PD_48]|nr:hypothetical protein FQN57_006007 [Myotisia sp. PD_48]